MRDEQIHGLALMLGTTAMLGTGLLHPTGAQMLASDEAFRQAAPLNVAAHGLALVGVWLTLFGTTGLSRRLGFARADVTAAMVAYALVAVLIGLAGVVDGFVLTRLAGGYVESGDAHEREVYLGFMKYSYNIASSISRVYVTGTALAVLLWSLAIWRTRVSRALPVVGLVIALAAVAAQLLGHLRMNVHDVLLLAAGQGVWLIGAGALLLFERAREESPASVVTP